jgi:radical SAM protein with 4Fe4S-binding SPASM domain
MLRDHPHGELDAHAHRIIRTPSARLDTVERRDAFGRLARARRTVKLHLTAACNLRCSNCYSDPAARDVLTHAEIVRLLDELRGSGCRLDLLGGEPLVRPDLVELIRYARREVGIDSIFLYTNGTLIDDTIAVKLAAAGLDTAIVSLHGPEAAIHERMTGRKGTFDLTLRGIDSLARAGVRTYTFTVVCAINASRLDGMKAFASTRGAAALFFPYVPQRAHDGLCIADPAKLREALSFVVRASYVYRAELLRSLAEGCKLCRAFTRTVTVLADGTVTPCPFATLGIGNVRQKPLQRILAESYCHPELAEFLADPPECSTCSIRGVCGGGCRAGRFTVYGDRRGKDLNCLAGPFEAPISVGALPDYLPYVY